MEKGAPIGIFDSGIGGISVYRKIIELLPQENIIYFADQANMPYGNKDLPLIRSFAEGITHFLLNRHCKIIVIACNTACAAALHPLRKKFSEVLFVGMEPAVKPAAENTQTGVVGILATAGTFKGEPYAGVVARFARGVRVYEQPCPGLAEAIESDADTEYLKGILTDWILPLKEKGIDQLALACTHYPLIKELIQEVAGAKITVIDPAEAIARRVAFLLKENDGLSAVCNFRGFYSTAAEKYSKSPIVCTEFEKATYLYWDLKRCLKEF